ncbi:MAG TPA: glycosyltransferase [Ktedonobacterales bacterium]|nr:glycosyltransferase [Ktedonobacterales bacterium]
MGDNERFATQARVDVPGAALQASQGEAVIAPGKGATRGRSLTHAAAIRLGGRMAKIAASVIAFGLAARALGGHDLGNFVTVFAFIQLFNTVANFGVDRILIRDLAQPERQPGGHVAFTHATVTSRLLIAIGISGLCATVAAVVGFSPEQLVSILLFLPYIVISAFGTNGMYGSVLQARNDNNSIALASIISAVVVVGGTVGVIFLHPTVNAFLAIYTISSLADTVICAFTSRKFVRWGMSWSGPLTRYLLAESLPLAIGSAFVLVYGRIDIILLERLIGADQAALYGVAYKFYDVLSTVSATIMIVLFPGLARAYAESITIGKRLYSQVFTLMAAIVLPMTFAVLVFHPILLTILVGQGYSAAAAALPGLMLAITLIFPSSVASYMLVVVRQQRWNLPMAIVASVLNIGLNLLLIPHYGFVAAAWITAVTEGFVIIFNVSAVALTTRLFPSPSKVFFTILATAPFALALLPGILSYVGGVVGIILFLGLLVVFGVVRPAQVRALVSSRPSTSVVAEETAGEEMDAVLPALAYVARSDQPSLQLAAIRSRRAISRNWETSMYLKAVRPEDLLEPPRTTKRRQVAGFFGGVLLLAGISAACIAFVPAGIEIATMLVFAAMLGLVAVRPQWALFIFLLALPLHNFLMALLYHATGDASFVKVVQPWKEVVLVIALLRVGLPALLTWVRARRLRLTALDVLVLLFMGVCLVSVAIPNHEVPLVGRVLGFRQLAIPFIAYFLGRLAPPTRREFRWLVGTFAFVALVMAIGAIGERLIWGGNVFTAINFGKYNKDFFGSTFPLPHNMGYTYFTGTPGWLPRAGSFVMNPLDLATLLTIALPIVLATLPFFKRYWGWGGNLFFGLAIVLGSTGVVLAFSRTNLLMFPVEVMLVIFIIGIRRQWPGALLAALGIFIGASLFGQISAYVVGGEDPAVRVERALLGMLTPGVYTVPDVVVPTVTLIAMAGAVAAIIRIVQALLNRQGRVVARWSVAGVLALVIVAGCLMVPPLSDANTTGILAPLVPNRPVTVDSTEVANSASGDNTSTQGHLESYKQMVPFMLQHPLGYGIGSAGFVGVRLGTGLGTESAYLPVGAQLGIPGLLLYLAVFLAILYTLWNATRARLDRLTRAVFVGALAAWVFVMVDGIITEVTLNFFVVYVMLWLAGSAVSLTRWTKVSWNADTMSYQSVRPLRVAMDAQCLHTARTGVRTYVTKLLEEFVRSDMPHEVVAIAGPRGLPRTNVVFRMFDQVLTLIWLHVVLPLRLSVGGYDILFSPEYLTPVWCPIACVVTYHDSAFLRRPQDYNRLWQLMFRWVNLPAVRRADAIIVPSHYTMTEAIRYAKFPPERLRITPLGGPQPGSMDVSDEIAAQTLERFGLVSGSYLLHVGVLERRKNLPMLVEAFAQLKARGVPDTFKLVLVGQPGPRPDLNDAPAIRDAVERLGLRDQVVLTGHISREEVNALFTHTATYVLPSKSEGFGIPVLEAFAAGVPLVCSTAGALPEVAGDAALMFDPDNVTELVECLTRIGSDPALRTQLIAAGKERAEMFTWHKTALATMETFAMAAVHSYTPAHPFLSEALEEESGSVVNNATR